MRLFCLFALTLFTLVGFSKPTQAGLMDDVYQLTDSKQYEAALDKLNAFLKTNPKDAQARFLKGLVLTERGERDDAIVIFQDLSKDFPDLPEPYNNLAVLYAEKGKYELARTALQKAIKTHPSYATAHENLGDIYAKMASKSYRTALTMNDANQGIKTKLTHINKVFATAEQLPVVVANNPAPSIQSSPEQKTDKAGSDMQSKDDLYDVELAINNWIEAWSSLNIDNYLHSYSINFRPPTRFPNYTAWVKNRKIVLGNAKSIRVTITNLRIKLLEKDLARAEFKQSYWSPKYQDQVNKTLTLAREGTQWKIVWERSEQ
ncbi:MAG: tetratricopeptide repeat protein [Magnetococcales bacterium]|nr:tetratricopeptide repeat protein [Magnetococcales bacterium]